MDRWDVELMFVARSVTASGVIAPPVALLSVGPAVTASTASGTAAVTPGLPSGTLSGDRVFIATTVKGGALSSIPTGWTQSWINNNLGRQYGIWRDYDGLWSMPTLSIVSGSSRAQCAIPFTLRKRAGLTWLTPTSIVATDSSSGTGYSVNTGSFTSHADGFMGASSAPINGATLTGENFVQTGAVFAGKAEMGTGRITSPVAASLVLQGATVTTGAAAAVTVSGTLGAATTVEAAVFEQRAT